MRMNKTKATFSRFAGYSRSRPKAPFMRVNETKATFSPTTGGDAGRR
ncbi:hypothetical protein [Rhodococcus triatomae]